MLSTKSDVRVALKVGIQPHFEKAQMFSAFCNNKTYVVFSIVLQSNNLKLIRKLSVVWNVADQ